MVSKYVQPTLESRLSLVCMYVHTHAQSLHNNWPIHDLNLVHPMEKDT